MPEISRFLGIKIFIHYNEHNPPHFHAKYGGYKAVFSIKEICMTEGELPPRVVALVTEWALLHKEELLQDWELARENAILNKIKGLV